MRLVFNLLSIKQINLIANLICICPIPLKYGPMNENCLDGYFLKQAISAEPNPPGKGVVIAVPGSYLLRSYRVVTAVRWGRGRGHPQESRSMSLTRKDPHPNLPATLTPQTNMSKAKNVTDKPTGMAIIKWFFFCEGLNPLIMESRCTLWN